MRIAFILFYIGHLHRNAIADNASPPPGPRPGIDFIGPLWLPRTYKVTCCRGGQPVAENEELITNWTQKASDYAVDERVADGADNHCRVFEGTFLLSAAALFNFSFTGYGVQCKCPDETDALDKHCRRLAPCQNNGYRSQSLGMMCACNEPYFGEYCDKICDQGQVLKGVDGRSYCSCLPFYQGEQCTDMVCLNGGVEVHGRCTCPPTFVGYHCEVDANRTVQHGSRFHRFGETNELLSRDISGTIFSLVMIIVLVVSMYLLMKHRMQVQSRYAASRREEMARAAAAYGISRRGDVIAPEDLRIAPFVAAGIDGPPPYVLHTYGRARNEILPPLPTYEDATKELPIRLSSPGETSEPPHQLSTQIGQPSTSPENSHADDITSSTSAPTSGQRDTLERRIEPSTMSRTPIYRRSL
ncbi:unnamed protein product [Cylicocyclus nassatus]|uniref:EGF-like domain-containing protein n=1 Tax=Cylicocyclus nassatus TaxID=53992 RepID=A0AA36DKA8_CYLNA|nr:unnamed protein product [Cylicocyclus nassatus]